jgi:hypothetical protein
VTWVPVKKQNLMAVRGRGGGSQQGNDVGIVAEVSVPVSAALTTAGDGQPKKFDELCRMMI